MKFHFYIGLATIAVSEVLLIAGVTWVTIFFTPLVWTGYILFIDGIVFKVKDESWIATRTKALLLMIPLSVGFWCVFEFFNLFLKNWKYEGLPAPWITAIGMAWAFATIGPAMMETTELIEVSRIFKIRGRRLRFKRGVSYPLIIVGALCLISIVVTPPHIARYLAIPLWMGFILFLEPMNYLKRRKSIFYDWEEGNWQPFLCLLFAGLICGFLWEFWNYWAYSRWIYEVPYAGSPKIFEMPLFGYLGFPLLAIEYHAFYSATLNWKR